MSTPLLPLNLPLPTALLAICAGASIGAVLRWGLGLWLNTTHATLPWGTLAANWIGAYLIGLCIALFEHHPSLDPHWRLALITGFLGALTTFSTFSAEVIGLLQQGRYAAALASSSLHLLGSLALTVLGMRTWGWVGK